MCGGELFSLLLLLLLLFYNPTHMGRCTPKSILLSGWENSKAPGSLLGLRLPHFSPKGVALLNLDAERGAGSQHASSRLSLRASPQVLFGFRPFAEDHQMENQR